MAAFLLEVSACVDIYAISIALASLGLVAGCPDCSISEVNPAQQGAVTKEIPVSADVDILFVIDNSASTADKQTVFASNFPNFVTALDAFPTGRPNLHIGVVRQHRRHRRARASARRLPVARIRATTACSRTRPACTGCTPPTGRFISDVAGAGGSAAPRGTNYTGTLDHALACIAQVGTTGCGFEAHLEA